MPKKLIVVVPGIGSRTQHWHALKAKLEQAPELQDAEWFIWNHGASVFSNASAVSLSRSLHAKIANKHLEKDFDEIVLVGHSLGGMLVRSAYLMAVDSQYGGPDVSAWGSKVSRIVLLASLNKGVDTKRVKFHWITLPITNLINTFRPLLVTDLWMGAGFISNLRIGWISYFGSNRTSHFPTVVQLLGTKDGIVSANDSMDVVQFRNAHHVYVPDASHRDLHRLDVLKEPGLVEERFEILLRAVAGMPSHVASDRSEPEKKLVIFILPGIRDASSKWTQELKAAFKKKDPSVEVEIGNYGYFSAAKFFLPWVRRKNVRFFQDQYSEVLAKYPDAEFSCVGHSNGTYILGKSLSSLTKMRFNRIYLAGSVLPEDYDWNSRLKSKQVSFVRNDRAAKDWPVAILCKGMRGGLGMKDVGVGGFDGFENQVTEFHFYNGGHDEAIKSFNHPVIVDYILNGQGTIQLQGTVSNFFRIFSNLSPWLVRLLLLLLTAWIGYSAYLFYMVDPSAYYWLGSGVVALLLLYIVLDIV
jgi:pimeloyl-ACP methyl ester carboxylesterase